MKNPRFLIWPLISCMYFSTSCNRNNGPADVAKDFVEHVNNKEFDAARNLGTMHTISFLNVLEGLTKNNDTLNAIEGEIKIISTKIHGDTAVCIYNYNDENEILTLVKIDNEWKVDLSKN